MYSADGHSGRPTTEVVDAGKVYLTTGRLGNYSKVPLAMSFMPSESNACWHEHVEFVVNTFKGTRLFAPTVNGERTDCRDLLSVFTDDSPGAEAALKQLMPHADHKQDFVHLKVRDDFRCCCCSMPSAFTT